MAVYFIQAVGGGPIKIGYSADVDTRIKQLESHYGQPLALLATMPGGRTEERVIHERFATFRFGKTEQFRPEPELLAFIGRPLFVSATPLVEAMEGKKRPVIAVKCWSAYKEWLEEFADAERTTPSQLFDVAVMEWAKARGFKPPPKR